MNVTRKEQRIIQRALNAWQASGELTPSDSQRLAHTLRVSPFDWRRLSRYAFWTALACVLIALGSLFADSELVAWLLSLFSHSALTRILLPALLAVVCYGWGFRRQRRETQWHYSTEAILFLGVVFTAVSLWQLGERLDNGSGHIAPLFLAGCVIYGAIGYIARSGLVWLFFLLALGNWFGAETGYVSGWGAYWLGMNYPIRFVLFGGALLRRAIPASPAAAVYRQQGDGPHVPVYCAVDPVDFRQLRRRQLVPGEPGATLAVGAAVCRSGRRLHFYQPENR
ncbi:membrane protein [Klebsiella variicola]|nr:membrane protein [Klebsiella variicola]SXF80139.1 membrane protein [Klebsiella variicola]